MKRKIWLWIIGIYLIIGVFIYVVFKSNGAYIPNPLLTILLWPAFLIFASHPYS